MILKCRTMIAAAVLISCMTCIFTFSNGCNVTVTPQAVLVNSNIASGTPIFNVTIYDSTFTTVTIVKQNIPTTIDFTNFFVFNSTKSQILFNGTFDTQAAYPYFSMKLQVSCSSSSTVLSGDFVVSVTYVNNIPPKWIPDGYSIYPFSISETAALGSAIKFTGSSSTGQVSIDSSTRNSGDLLLLSLLPSPNYDYFRVNGSVESNYAPTFVLNKIGLDYNNIQNILLYPSQLLYEGSYNTTYKFNSTTIFNVSIIDEDNHPPIFNATSYTANILSNATANQSLVMSPSKIRAYDGDIFMNVPISFTISFTDTDLFQINGQSGEITLVRANPTVGQYNLQVKATQSNDPTKIAVVSVVITVQPTQSYYPPTCRESPYSATISENAPNQTIIRQLSVIDQDAMNLTYKLLTYASVFNIDNTIGTVNRSVVVTMQSALDYEVQTQFIVPFTAVNRLYTCTCTLLVNLLDVTEFYPKFTTPDKLRTVNVTRSKGLVIATVTAASNDYRQTLSFKLMVYTNLFEISPSNGTVTIIADPSALVLNSYVLQVEVSNNVPPIRTDTMSLTVSFIDNPTGAVSTGISVAAIVAIAVVLSVALIASIVAFIICYRRMRTKALSKRAPSHFGESTYSYADMWVTSLQDNYNITGYDKDKYIYRGDNEISEMEFAENYNPDNFPSSPKEITAPQSPEVENRHPQNNNVTSMENLGMTVYF